MGDGKSSRIGGIDGELPCKVVQRTIEILDDITRDQRNCFGERISGMDINDMLYRFRITLFSDSVRGSLLEGSDDFVQLTEVLVGPLDF